MSLCVRLPVRSKTSICCRKARRMSPLSRVAPRRASMPRPCALSRASTTNPSGSWCANRLTSNGYLTSRVAASPSIVRAAECVRSRFCYWPTMASALRLAPFCHWGRKMPPTRSAQESSMPLSSSSLRARRSCARRSRSLMSGSLALSALQPTHYSTTFSPC